MRRWWKGILIGWLAASGAAADSDAPLIVEREINALKLRPAVSVSGLPVTLAQVLDFSQADPLLEARLGPEPVLADSPAAAAFELTHRQVVQRLDALGANLARVLVNGAYRCRVTVAAPAARGAAQVVDDSDTAPLLRTNRIHDGAATLADAIRSYAAQKLGASADDVEVGFERGRSEFLELSAPPFEFKVRGSHGASLGMREFRVSIYRDGRLHRNMSIFGRVQMLARVVVASRPLNTGSTIRRDSVEYAKRMFAGESKLGVQNLDEVLGQRIKRFVPAGQMLRADAVAAVELVQRSRPVTVVGGGHVGLRLTGTALDSGGYGETVRVRLGDSRKERRVLRAMVIGVSRVRLSEDD